MRVSLPVSLGFMALAMSACSDDSSGPSADELKSITANYAEVVYATYSDALSTAEALEDAIQAFVAAPSEATLTAAKTAWLAAREPYGLTEAFRFYAGPIDSEDGPEGDLNAWPLDESFIDYVEGNANAGIINATSEFPEITAELLREKNEDGGASEVSITLGYHAIEFLLWGQDLSDDGPGARPVSDYIDAVNADRRKAFLAVATELLVEDLSGLVEEWAPNADNYRKAFVALDGKEGLRRILSGVGVLSNGELAGERMDVALDTRDQEDEHSCFSDNTHRDIITNAQGIVNVLTGKYDKVVGSSVVSVLAKYDTVLSARLLAAVEASVKLAEAIPTPFDQALSSTEGRAAIAATIASLREQGDIIIEAAEALGIKNLSVELPEE